jgi:hypothetical protein
MFELEPHHRDIPDADLIADVKDVASKLNLETLTMEKYQQHGRFHPTTLTRRFGSWFVVQQQTGLKRSRNLNISNEELFENLARVWVETGSQPKYASLAKTTSAYSSGTYEKRFGTWRKSLEAFVVWAKEGVVPALSVPQSANSAPRTPRNINWRLRALVLMRDNARCQMCGKTPQDGVRLHVDHISPWRKGGETILENLQILCEQCNIGKSDVVIEDETLK